MLDLLRRYWQLLLPSPCLWCQLPVSKHQHLLCSSCQAALPTFPYHLCHYNLLWLPSVSQGLPQTHFDRLLSISWYQLPYQHWIRRWKFHSDLYAAELLKQCFKVLVSDYQHSGLPLPEAAVYVPMTPYKQRKRGFNQAKILAECAATELGIPLLDIISRKQDRHSQVGLTREQRQQNLAGVFYVNNRHPLPAHLVLIDDVVTTGATANQLSELLKQHGVMEVSVWTLTITPAANYSTTSGAALKP